MAYLDLSQPVGTPVATPHDVPTLFQALGCGRKAEGLSALEWRVVELAREDSFKSLVPQRKRHWTVRLVLGPPPQSRMLADERLEALRRLAVHAWHMGYTLPASVMKQAIKSGYSDLQVGQVIDTIVGRRLELRENRT